MAYFAGHDLWDQLRHVARQPGKKVAAVAYYSMGSPLAFDRGDVVIVDASEDAIRGGQTSAGALLKLAERGVKVFSLNRLHAKVLLAPTAAVVGSANLSASSTTMHEAGVVLTEPLELDSVRAFLQELRREAKQLSRNALKVLAALPVEQRYESRTSKPSLLRAISEGHRELDDVAFGYYGGAADLSRKEVALEAERTNLPLRPGWTWFEYTEEAGLRQRILAEVENRPSVHWVVQFRPNGSLQRFRRQETFARTLSGLVTIKRTLATVFGPKGFVTPFDLASDAGPLVTILNRGLVRAPRPLLNRINNDLAIIQTSDLRGLLTLGLPE